MGKEDTIRKATRALVKDMIPMTIQWAKVESVDEESGFMTVIGLNDNLPYEDVLCSISGAAIFTIPAKDSKVLIGMIENSDMNAVLLMCEQLKSYLITLENGFKLHLKDDGTMMINGDNYGGLVKIKELKTNLKSLKTAIETIKTAVASGIAAVGAGAAANGATGASAFNAAVASVQINLQNMENTTIKHG